MKSLLTSILAVAVTTAPLQVNAATRSKSSPQHNIIQRVLLVSIDGMHALDYQNCSTASRREQRRALLPEPRGARRERR